jgi:hypothetical protein
VCENQTIASPQAASRAALEAVSRLDPIVRPNNRQASAEVTSVEYCFASEAK